VSTPSCAEIRTQISQLQAKRFAQADVVLGDQGDLQELESDKKHVKPDAIAKAKARLAAAQQKLKEIDDQLASARAQLQGMPGEAGKPCVQPQGILEVSPQFANPPGITNLDVSFVQTVALGKPNPTPVVGGPFPSLDAELEWKQVLPENLGNTVAHTEDYEGTNLVGASGWALIPEFSGEDVPFDHPFGFDWEFQMALDQPPNDPKRFTFLLSPGNQSCKEENPNEHSFEEAVTQFGDKKDAQGRNLIPLGQNNLPSLLGVEMDRGLIPRLFQVESGDRIAVFGRWIVDCGHQKAILDCNSKGPGTPAFRTEIHPPLLMAAASVSTASLASPSKPNAHEFTRVLFTSRPYLVGQRFTTDLKNVYDDAAADDGPFVSHMIRELVKVNETLAGIPTSSIQIEAHPKIKSFPFQASYAFQLTVRPPAPGAVAPGPLAVAFQFTVRTGCSVQITEGSNDSIDVVIRLSQDGYTPPPLPPRSEQTWTRDALNQLDQDAGTAFLAAEAGSAIIKAVTGDVLGAGVVLAILNRGILTDAYDTRTLNLLNILDASHALSAQANNIPPNLATLQQERTRLAGVVRGDEGDLKELTSEHASAAAISKAKARLADDQKKLKQIDDQIAALTAAGPRGVLIDDNQPFPIFGWLEVGFLANPNQTSSGSPTA
jgi:hypothetical protein